jgi:putative hemolysin
MALFKSSSRPNPALNSHEAISKTCLLGLLLLLALPAVAGTSSGAGCGNPASVYCNQVGGQSFVVLDADGGQRGLCRLTDDSVIEEWTLFRGETKAVAAFLGHKPNFGQTTDIEAWEKASCESAGGKIQLLPEAYRPTLKWAMCQFSDRSGIEARTLTYGPEYYPSLKKTLENSGNKKTSCF